MLYLLQDGVAEQVLQASLEKVVFQGILVPEVSLDPKDLLDLWARKDRRGELVTKVHKVQLGQQVFLETLAYKAWLVPLVLSALLESLVCYIAASTNCILVSFIFIALCCCVSSRISFHPVLMLHLLISVESRQMKVICFAV